MLKDKYDKGKLEAEWEKWETWVAGRVNEN